MITLEQIKTLINGLKLIIPPWVKPDWDENDENSPHYVKNRPLYKQGGKVAKKLDEEFLPDTMPSKYVEEAKGLVEEKVSSAIDNYDAGLFVSTYPGNGILPVNPYYGPIRALQVEELPLNGETVLHAGIYRRFVQSHVGLQNRQIPYRYVEFSGILEQTFPAVDIFLCFRKDQDLIVLNPVSKSGYSAGAVDFSYYAAHALEYDYIDPETGSRNQVTLHDRGAKNGEFVRHVRIPYIHYYTDSEGNLTNHKMKRGYYLNSNWCLQIDGVDYELAIYRIQSSAASNPLMYHSRLGLAVPPWQKTLDLAFSIPELSTMELNTPTQVSPVFSEEWGEMTDGDLDKGNLDFAYNSFQAAVNNELVQFIVSDRYRVQMVSANWNPTLAEAPNSRVGWQLEFHGEDIKFRLWYDITLGGLFAIVYKREDIPSPGYELYELIDSITLTEDTPELSWEFSLDALNVALRNFTGKTFVYKGLFNIQVGAASTEVSQSVSLVDYERSEFDSYWDRGSRMEKSFAGQFHSRTLQSKGKFTGFTLTANNSSLSLPSGLIVDIYGIKSDS